MILSMSQDTSTSVDTLQVQDHLLMAGSKISFKDIYNKEMDIPLIKGKFYKASDVDDVFILLNGVLTDVSEQTFRQNKQMSNLRNEVQQLTDSLANEHSIVSSLESSNQQLQSQLDKRELELKKVLIQYKHILNENKRLTDENGELEILIDRLVEKIENES